MVDDPGGSPVTQKMTLGTLAASGLFNNNSIFHQALINGGFDVWQRNTTFTYNDDTYGPDRWNLLTETNGAWTLARDTDVPAGLGFKYSAKLSCQTANNQAAIVQILENVDSMKLDDGTVSLSFYAKTTAGEIGTLRAAVLSWSSTADTVTSDVIGTWAQDGTNPTWAANWTAENTATDKDITDSWARYTITGISIDTASMANIAVVVWVDDGTIAQNDDFWITGIQLNVGSVALPFTPKSYEVELDACERYCQAYVSSAGAQHQNVGVAYSTTAAYFVWKLKKQMRAAPTLTVTAADYQLHDFVNAAIDCTNVALDNANLQSENQCSIFAQVAAGLTQYRMYYLRADGGAVRTMIFTAEL